MNEVAVIGGGASGLMAALEAAKNGARVTIFEHKDRIGKKILMTGNGKCNFSNLSFSDKDYYTDNFEVLNEVFHMFSNIDMKNYLISNGIKVKDKNNYLYPYTEQAATILDFFRRELSYYQVKIITESEIIKISQNLKEDNGCFTLEHKEQTEKVRDKFNCIILACGGKAAPQSGSDGSGYQLAKEFGHTVIQPLPSLVQLRSSESYFKSIAGVRCEAEIKLCVDGKILTAESGELQLTEYGISGIPVFQLSGAAAEALEQKKRVEALIDFIPGTLEKELIRQVISQIERLNKLKKSATFEEVLFGLINKKLLLMMLKQSGFRPEDSILNIRQADLEKLIHRMKTWYVKIVNTNPFANAQVCRGGVSCKEMNSDCESLLVPGLFFAGEIVNVDGRCGGYNLQWAWSSGYVAGKNAAYKHIN